MTPPVIAAMSAPDAVLELLRGLFDGWEKNAPLLKASRAFLISSYHYWITALFILLVLFLLLSAPAAVRCLRRISSRTWVWLFWIFNGGAALRIFWSLRIPQVYFDEVSFLSTAQNLAQSGLNHLMVISPGDAVFLHPCPIGWQYLVALVFRLAGVEASHAFNLSCVLACIDILLVFAAVYLMMKDEKAALVSALLLAVHPVALRLSGSAALENGSLFFFLLSLVLLSLFLESRSPVVLFASFLSLSFLGNIRMENSFVIVPLLVLYLVVKDDCRRTTWRSPAAWAALAVMALGLVPALLSDWYGLATRFYFFHESREMMKIHIDSNLRCNFLYWVDNSIHPVVMTLLALAGLVELVRRGGGLRRDGIFWGGWLVLLTAYYSMNPSCDFSLRHTLDSWRNAVHPIAAVILLAGGGFAMLRRYLSAPVNALVTGLLVAALLLTPFQYEEFIHTRHPWMCQYEFQRSIAPMVPEQALLLVDGDFTRGVTAYNMFMSSFFAMGRRVMVLKLSDQFFSDVQHWRTVERRRVFIYYLSFGTEWDREHLAALLEKIVVNPVAWQPVESHGHTMSFHLLEVKGLREELEKEGGYE